MSREIKFRAWNGKEMLHQPLCSTFGLHRFFGFIPVDAKLMEYTGLKDKNGKEIFEGDVISYWNGTMRMCKETDEGAKHYGSTDAWLKNTENKLKQVIFDAPSFRIESGNPLGSQYLDGPEIEVIGNIYENPELLEPNNG